MAEEEGSQGTPREWELGLGLLIFPTPLQNWGGQKSEENEAGLSASRPAPPLPSSPPPKVGLNFKYRDW